MVCVMVCAPKFAAWPVTLIVPKAPELAVALKNAFLTKAAEAF